MNHSRLTLATTCTLALGIIAGITLRTENTPGNIAQSTTSLSLTLPSDTPESFRIALPLPEGEAMLELERNKIFGTNTKVFIDDGSGGLQQIQAATDRCYLGSINNQPGTVASATLSKKGLYATISRPGKDSLTIEPVTGSGRHLLRSSPVVNKFKNLTPIRNPDDAGVAASTGPITTSLSTLATPVLADSPETTATGATLPPQRVMDVLEYEIGVEIGSRAFFADSAYGGDLEKAQASAQSIVNNLDARYLRAAGIKHRLGTVIIRNNKETDPLRESVTRTGGGGEARKSLAAFKNFWNNNPDKVGTTHDLAVYHVKHAPSGLAYVNSVGSQNRYATTGGNGPTSWANGTLVHEFGHSWNLKHTNESGFFYEDKPRDGNGANSPGGELHYVSIMHGGGNHNIGRLATEEANMVYRIREQKREFGDLVENPGPIPPFGHRDIFSTKDGEPITVDVIANDYDSNNDVLEVNLLDSVSLHGGTIVLSRGTGPGGRSELTYTPPADFVGRDLFHYHVVDSTGRRDWGAVYVTNLGKIKIDRFQDVYNYDLGPLNATVETRWAEITPQTRGDIFWKTKGKAPLGARDRGLSRRLNNINRDFICSSSTSTLSHRIANGIWAITLNMGDQNSDHDEMKVMAEDKVLASGINAKAGEFPYVHGEVMVNDTILDLTFSDEGGKDPNWAVSRLTLKRVRDLPVEVDLSRKSYHYDLGPTGSPVEEGWELITSTTNGDIEWSGDAVDSRDRNPGGKIGKIHRDFIHSDGHCKLHHRIANGHWQVILNMGDPRFEHDLMGVKAEGRLISDAITSPAGQYSFVDAEGAKTTETSFDVIVSDGELELEFFDNGGTDFNWAVSRLSLQRLK